MSKWIFLLISVLMVVGCSTDTTQQLDAELTVAEINANTGEYVEKTVSITGTVNHVCRHGGKRLFVMSDDASDRFKVEAGQVGSFDVALEGSKVRVVGVVKELKVDKAYLDNWEKEVCAAEAENEAQKYTSDNEGEEHAGNEQANNPTLQNINALRQELVTSEQTHLSFYHLEAISFEEVM